MTAIVAVSPNWGIGYENHLLFHSREDLQFFRATTLGHPVVMGRKTYESLPRRPLPDRENIILTRDPSLRLPGVTTIHSAKNLPPDAFCIGGGEVYRLLLPQCDTVYVTKFPTHTKADTFFPNLDNASGWTLTETRKGKTDLLLFCTYKKTGT